MLVQSLHWADWDTEGKMEGDLLLVAWGVPWRKGRTVKKEVVEQEQGAMGTGGVTQIWRVRDELVGHGTGSLVLCGSTKSFVW